MTEGNLCDGFEELAHRLGAWGCTEEEVAAVRRDQGGRLPRSYECFLGHLGRDAGGLFGGSDLCYPQNLGLRKEAEALTNEDPEARFVLPDDAVVIWMHQGYQFAYLCCSEGDDPLVRYWLERTEEPTVDAHSLLEWIEQEEASTVLPPAETLAHRAATKSSRRFQFEARGIE